MKFSVSASVAARRLYHLALALLFVGCVANVLATRAAAAGFIVQHNVGALSGAILGRAATLVGTGSVMPRAARAGQTNHHAAVHPYAAFHGGKANVIVTLGNLHVTYNGSARAVTATTSPPNLAVDFTYNGSATAPTAAGSYAVVATINDANQQGTANGTLVIGKATATITLGNLSPTYNGSARAVVATTSPANLAVDFTYDGNVAPPTAAGSYAVVGTIRDTNYHGSASGTLAIAKAQLVVTADAANRIYGDVDPAFTATITGFVDGETVAVISGAPSFSNDATVTSNVGAYTLMPSLGTLNANNYAFTAFTSGTLTVEKATLIAIADAKSRTYGSSEPTFTARLTGFVSNDASAVVTGAPAFSTDALLTSSVGNYIITPALGTLTAMNYSFSFAAGVLSVTKAPLTIAAASNPKR